MNRLVVAGLIGLTACGSALTSDQEAELAYLGLDGAVERAMDLGFQGFNEANSANIEPQTESGDLSGSLTVSGQVDQGASDNKGMRLDLTLSDYADRILTAPEDGDEIAITYDTTDEPPALDLSLRSLPAGELDGTLSGLFEMDGDLVGSVFLDVELTGLTEDDGAGGVQRVVGETRVVGTAESDLGGIYQVDLIR